MAFEWWLGVLLSYNLFVVYGFSSEVEMEVRFGMAYCLADAYSTNRPVPQRYRTAFEAACRQPTYSQALQVWLRLLAAEADRQVASEGSGGNALRLGVAGAPHRTRRDASSRVFTERC